MHIPRKHWLWFVFLSLFSFGVWFQLTYPQFSFIKLAVSRQQALAIARDYLIRLDHTDPSRYTQAVIFNSDDNSDRFLQKAVGFKRETAFLKQHHYEFFSWTVRFFRENEKEEYLVTVSAATGQVTGFVHKIKESDSRPERSQRESRERMLGFLQDELGLDPREFIIHSEHALKLDHRTDYSFSWEKKGVVIPWRQDKDVGYAKLLTGGTISGDEILSFRKLNLKIPDPFYRFISQQMNTGQNLAVLFRIIYFSLLTASIFFVVVRRNDLVMHTVKRFGLVLATSFFVLLIVHYFNNFHYVLFQYPTTSTMAEFLWRNIMKFFTDSFIVTIGILMPFLAGETLHYEVFQDKRRGAFLHYLTSSVFSRDVFQWILIGYFGAVMMIGLQSAIFEIGQRFCGVWVEQLWLTQASSGYWPFLTIFVVGYSASFSEEISFRIFSISLGKKFLKNTFLAILIAALMWGFGHTTYRIFPMWFRGIEVTCLGLLLGWLYVRYGIIPVLVAHFLFDVFWGSSAFLLGKAREFDFYSSLAILVLPLLFGLLAYVLNRPSEERPMRWNLNRHQLFNLDILKNYLADNPQWRDRNRQELRDEIVSHGWDMAVVEKALEEMSSDGPVDRRLAL